MRRALPSLLVAAALLVAGSATVAACSAQRPDDTLDGSTADSGSFPLDGSGLDAPTGDTKIDPDAACGAVREQGTSKPLNLYVVFDKSSSMGPEVTSTKWAGARKGLGAFLADSSSAGLRIAINFFPRKPDGTPACDSAPYMTPRVPFDVLPKNAKPITDAIDAELPDGFDTPIYPALGGAIRQLLKELETRPGEAAAVLLVTDGAPAGPAALCGTVNPEDPKAIADLAATGVAKGVLTYVVGLPGVSVSAANQIAAGGGTTSAVLATDPTSVEKQFQEALATVRGKAIPCEFELPTKVAKGEISYGLVNVEYSKGGVPPSTPILQDPACSGPGWRYDDAVKPTKIVLCPATCDEVHKDPKARIDILLGCKTQIK